MGSVGKQPGQIAIRGIGLPLPGGINSSQNHWDLLINARDAKSEIGQNKFNPSGLEDTLGGGLSIRHQNGNFLHQDLGLFDHFLFSLTRNEAERCDPQQRLLLEVARECLEDAGETNYRGRPVGCYVRSLGLTWMRLQTVANYLMTNQISYEYDLAGPRYGMHFSDCAICRLSDCFVFAENKSRECLDSRVAPFKAALCLVG